MKANILMTGSSGNCVVATFSDGYSVIFDFGEGASNVCPADVIKRSNVFITHLHKDHAGDFGKIKDFYNKDIPSFILVKKIEIKHSIENHGYIVANTKTSEAFFYFTDYTEILDLQSYVNILEVLQKNDFKIFAMLELNHFSFLKKMLSENMQYGLNYHANEKNFLSEANRIKQYFPESKIITLHASQRADYQGSNGWNGCICPENYAIIYFAQHNLENTYYGKAFGFDVDY